MSELFFVGFIDRGARVSARVRVASQRYEVYFRSRVGTNYKSVMCAP